MNHDTSDLRKPWYPIAENAADFVKELKREVSRHHVLYGIGVEAIGRRYDRDDVLFSFDAGFAVVHLTDARREKDPDWPITQMYPDWESFLSQRMKQDVLEYGGDDT